MQIRNAFVLFAVLFLIGCVQQNLSQQEDLSDMDVSDRLPDSFTIRMRGDFTSSGGDRIFEANLTFKDGRLVNGLQRSIVYQGGAAYTNFGEGLYNCKCKFNVQESSWGTNLYSEGSKDCCRQDYPVTTDELQKRIDAGDIIPLTEECEKRILHKWCYKITR